MLFNKHTFTLRLLAVIVKYNQNDKFHFKYVCSRE